MATINFLLQSQKDTANIYVRFSNGRKTVLKKKTGFVINPKEWNEKKGQPIAKTEETKNLKVTLDKLSTFIESQFNDSISKGIDIDSDWLTIQINFFNNKTDIIELDILTNYIQKYIDDAPFKRNQKGSIGLSDRRITGLKTFQNLYSIYELEVFKGKKVLVKDVNLQFAEKFLKWLKITKGYNVNYVGRNINDLKTICNDAKKNGILTSTQLDLIKGVHEDKAPEDILYLNKDEQKKIKEAEITSEAYINARKWLLIGCLIGQRGGDLLKITEKNIRAIGEHKIIELKQEKTGKLVAIPVLPEAKEIIDSGMPYPISQTKFNSYIKEVCKIAKIDNKIKGKIKEGSHQKMKITELPKYKFISSHICRRSFASNYYDILPLSLLMKITAHSSEKMFRKYIGKTESDSATQMIEMLEKINNI